MATFEIVYYTVGTHTQIGSGYTHTGWIRGSTVCVCVCVFVRVCVRVLCVCACACIVSDHNYTTVIVQYQYC